MIRKCDDTQTGQAIAIKNVNSSLSLLLYKYRRYYFARAKKIVKHASSEFRHLRLLDSKLLRDGQMGMPKRSGLQLRGKCISFTPTRLAQHKNTRSALDRLLLCSI